MGCMYHTPHHPRPVSARWWGNTARHPSRIKAGEITQTCVYIEHDRVTVDLYSDAVGKLHQPVSCVLCSKVDAITGRM